MALKIKNKKYLYNKWQGIYDLSDMFSHVTDKSVEVGVAFDEGDTLSTSVINMSLNVDGSLVKEMYVEVPALSSTKYISEKQGLLTKIFLMVNQVLSPESMFTGVYLSKWLDKYTGKKGDLFNGITKVNHKPKAVIKTKGKVKPNYKSNTAPLYTGLYELTFFVKKAQYPLFLSITYEDAIATYTLNVMYKNPQKDNVAIKIASPPNSVDLKSIIIDGVLSGLYELGLRDNPYSPAWVKSVQGKGKELFHNSIKKYDVGLSSTLTSGFKKKTKPDASKVNFEVGEKITPKNEGLKQSLNSSQVQEVAVVDLKDADKLYQVVSGTSPSSKYCYIGSYSIEGYTFKAALRVVPSEGLVYNLSLRLISPNNNYDAVNTTRKLLELACTSGGHVSNHFVCKGTDNLDRFLLFLKGCFSDWDAGFDKVQIMKVSK